MDPNYHIRNGEPEKILERRETGYSVVRELIRTGRLVVKDANDGNTIAYAEKLIKYYKQKYPKRNIVYVLDNFHKLHDFEAMNSDERVRFKKVSNVMKDIATKFHICVITTVEYRKTKHGDHATNADIGETGQIEYDASLIAHLHNEVHERGKDAKIYHIGGTDMNPIQLPRIEVNIGKNKITAFKNRLFFDFFPENSDFVCVDERVTMDEVVEEVTAAGRFDTSKDFGY
jgi:replicative DNA helicase